ncbi:transposase [Acinetobacter courvalinii]|nr:transposase [Acinetobacter courvalinii]
MRYFELGEPQQNGYIERYNRTIRYSCLSKQLFDTLEEVEAYETSWL